MALLTVRPTDLDKRVASTVASHTDREVERGAEMVTWGADEHVLLGLAALGWLATRAASEPYRRFANHLLVCSLSTAALPHVMKRVVDQKRPDRLTVRGHLNGVPLSGKTLDAFPSGHALHVGALSSAATLLPAKARPVIWATGVVLVGTRVVLLAHWVTDVAAGLVFGAILERMIRPLTRPVPIPASNSKVNNPSKF